MLRQSQDQLWTPISKPLHYQTIYYITDYYQFSFVCSLSQRFFYNIPAGYASCCIRSATASCCLCLQNVNTVTIIVQTEVPHCAITFMWDMNCAKCFDLSNSGPVFFIIFKCQPNNPQQKGSSVKFGHVKLCDPQFSVIREHNRTTFVKGFVR